MNFINIVYYEYRLYLIFCNNKTYSIYENCLRITM